MHVPHGRVAIVAAHPDDEVIGAGTLLLRRPRDCHLIHLTDGAPRDMRDAGRTGFESRESYARARRRELYTAMAGCGVRPDACSELELVDQEAAFALCGTTLALAAIFEQETVGSVVTHPYEGGHPDHDAAAFACRAAIELLRRDGAHAPLLVEMTSYHAGPNGIRTGAFLLPSGPVGVVRLERAERAGKRAMLDAFTSQQEVLAPFGVECERFREAPRYRFDRAPHAGRLYYERFVRGLDGERWRRLAVQAAAGLHPRRLACR